MVVSLDSLPPPLRWLDLVFPWPPVAAGLGPSSAPNRGEPVECEGDALPKPRCAPGQLGALVQIAQLSPVPLRF